MATSRTPSGWLFQVLPLGLLVAVLISTGPFLQDHLFKVLGSDAPSVYAAVYQQGVISFPSLAEWFEFATHLRFLMIGLVAAHLALLRRRLWSVIAAFAVWTAVLLTALDLALVIGGADGAPDVLTGIVANAIGGVLIATVVGFVLPLYERLPKAFPGAGKAATATAAGFSVLAGICLSAVTYYIFELFFQPTPVEFTAVVKPPLKGFAGSAAKSGGEVLNFMPDEPTSAELTADSPGGQLRLDWSASSQAKGYHLTARLLTSCMQTDLNKLQVSTIGPAWENVKQVSLAFDKGFTLLQTGSKEKTRYTFGNRTPSTFWLNVADKGTVEATYFIDGDDTVVATTPDARQILFGAPLVRTHDHKAFLRPRHLTLIINGTPTVLDFQYQPTVGLGGRCRELPLPSDIKSGTVSVPSAMIAVLLTLTPGEMEAAAFDADASKLTIRGGNGWLTVSPIPTKDLSQSDVGGTDFVGFAADPISVELDGRKAETNSADQFVAFGDITADFLRDGNVKFAGPSQRLWKGQSRLNPTKWERLPGEAQLAALTAFIALISLLFRLVWWPAMKDLRDEDVTSWA